MNTAPESDHNPQTVPAEPPVVGDYEILALAGRGAFGAVWVARDLSGVLHALKVVDVARLPSSDSDDREEEALCLVRQRVPDHPYLVRISHVSRQEGRLIYAMELADPASGSPPPDQPDYRPDTLARRIAVHGPMVVGEAIRLALNLLTALDSLHQAQLVHRDVKPHNVIFVGGVAKLADIGLATVIRSSLSMAGTPGYLPLDGSTGPDADLYALGKLLYQCVTGVEPADFPAIPATLLGSSQARMLRRLNPVLLRACAPTRKERFQNTAAMQSALRALLIPKPFPVGKCILVCLVGALMLGLGAGALTFRNPADHPEATMIEEDVKAQPPHPEVTGAPHPASVTAPVTAPAKIVKMSLPRSSGNLNDDDFIKAVRALPPQEQARVVADKLKKRNPKLSGRMRASVRGGKVVAVLVPPCDVRDFSPLRALPDLVFIDCGSPTEHAPGQISDLSSLRGLKLTQLRFAWNQVTNLSALQGMSLEGLDCAGNSIRSLEPLRGMSLERLLCYNNQITDLSPVADMPLEVLNCGANPIENWSPLETLPLKQFYANFTSFRDLATLKKAKLQLLRCAHSGVTDLECLRLYFLGKAYPKVARSSR